MSIHPPTLWQFIIYQTDGNWGSRLVEVMTWFVGYPRKGEPPRCSHMGSCWATYIHSYIPCSLLRVLARFVGRPMHLPPSRSPWGPEGGGERLSWSPWPLQVLLPNWGHPGCTWHQWREGQGKRVVPSWQLSSLHSLCLLCRCELPFFVLPPTKRWERRVSSVDHPSYSSSCASSRKNLS